MPSKRVLAPHPIYHPLTFVKWLVTLGTHPKPKRDPCLCDQCNPSCPTTNKCQHPHPDPEIRPCKYPTCPQRFPARPSEYHSNPTPQVVEPTSPFQSYHSSPIPLPRALDAMAGYRERESRFHMQQNRPQSFTPPAAFQRYSDYRPPHPPHVPHPMVVSPVELDATSTAPRVTYNAYQAPLPNFAPYGDVSPLSADFQMSGGRDSRVSGMYIE
ncbi:hypothetical protein EJ08DRAFT_702874 [Tothia fuscella]|uniref:Uncharacterized protein n=1 Tax=Tothia fuscella TaxID=1048955 RepID=A0A9P4NFR5_9PEZI|nr:hypothetical protein EJ08DRAFT_702874 [Tothia fuscella]